LNQKIKPVIKSGQTGEGRERLEGKHCRGTSWGFQTKRAGKRRFVTIGGCPINLQREIRENKKQGGGGKNIGVEKALQVKRGRTCLRMHGGFKDPQKRSRRTVSKTSRSKRKKEGLRDAGEGNSRITNGQKGIALICLLVGRGQKGKVIHLVLQIPKPNMVYKKVYQKKSRALKGKG